MIWPPTKLKQHLTGSMGHTARTMGSSGTSTVVFFNGSYYTRTCYDEIQTIQEDKPKQPDVWKSKHRKKVAPWQRVNRAERSLNV